ncbi:MAG: hypothetical protein ACO38W_09730, partial [Phycisphaerales bacterium]
MKSLLSILFTAAITFAAAAPAAAISANAPIAPVAAEEQLVFRSGNTWRGSLGDRVSVEFTENGVVQTLEGTLERIEKKKYIQVRGTIAGRDGTKTILLGDVRSMISLGAGEAPAAAPSPTTTPSARKPVDRGTAAPEVKPVEGANQSAAS